MSYKPTYVDNTDNSISIMESTDTISFCKTGTKINTLSAKNVAHKKTGEDLNLCAYDGSSFNPVLTINNQHNDCRIMTNLNVSGNVNVLNGGTIKTTGQGSFGSLSVASSTQVANLNAEKLGGNLPSAFATASHEHSGIYATASHDHSGVYAAASHDHSGVYAAASHDHSGVYALASHSHSYAASSHGHSSLNSPATIGSSGVEVTSGYPLRIAGYYNKTGSWYTHLYGHSGFSQDVTASGGDKISLRIEESLWNEGGYYFINSDRRIKTNITDVPDNLALEQLRSIPCRYYEYIDKIERGSAKTIGFIAQEVKEVLLMAVTQQTYIIPNIYKIINCTWTSVDDKFNMSSTDLPNISNVTYRFYVSNATDASDQKMIEITGNSDNTFTFDAQYTNVFCYGSEVEDFHTLDETKLFTLNFSATQEIDRIQQTHITEIASLKTEVSTLKTENQQQQTKIDTLETENAELKSIIDKLKTANSFEEFKNSL